MRGSICQLLAVPLMMFLISGFAEAFTLDAIKQRGQLHCGVVAGVPGFSNPDEMGRWHGFNVEICRALAAATLGNADQVKYLSVNETTYATALLSGRVDVLSMPIPWSLTLDTAMGAHIATAAFYDGQSFLVRKRLGIKSALELEGATVCVQKQATDRIHLDDYFREHDIRIRVVESEELQKSAREFVGGRCDVLTGNRSRLHRLRVSFDRADDFMVLPEVISREPFGPIVRQGDDGWFNIVRWTVFALLTAEEYGLSSTTVSAAVDSDDPRIRSFLGSTGAIGRGLGLQDRWAYQIIEQVGNYAEIYERTVGQQSPLRMDRGLNALWHRGGLHYPPAIP